ncbi:MAG TPA: transcriptional repressor [Leucothrix mucor]|uniref:Transcriptional repressor n=1 Tax=Leucothrix mucor TaxID=45248 RepID=A0A7V2T1M1_LEUMU|nr:transcriptional repressor [Leucothrix mucor]
MNNIQECLERAESDCGEYGTRLTSKRKYILLSLLQSDKAMSAYEIVDFCKNEFGKAMPAMSVYRILDFLQQQLLVHKLNSANKFVACSHITCDHDHEVTQFLICNECLQVKEINTNQSTIKALQQNIKEAGFHLLYPQLEMHCLCENCMT